MSIKHTPAPCEVETLTGDCIRFHPKGKRKYRTKTADEFFATAKRAEMAYNLFDEMADALEMAKALIEKKRVDVSNVYEVMAAKAVNVALAKARGE